MTSVPDPQRPNAPSSTVDRVLEAVTPFMASVIRRADVRAAIVQAMRPKTTGDRMLLEGDGPLTFQQLAGLVERIQGWKGDWLREHMAIAGSLARKGVRFNGSPLRVIEDMVDRFTDQPGTIMIRVPVYQAGDEAMVTIKGWTINLTPEELERHRVRGVQAE